MKCAHEWLWCGCIVVAAATMLGVGAAGMLQPGSDPASRPKDSAIAPVVASMFTFDKVPALPLFVLIINGAKDETRGR